MPPRDGPFRGRALDPKLSERGAEIAVAGHEAVGSFPIGIQHYTKRKYFFTGVEDTCLKVNFFSSSPSSFPEAFGSKRLSDK